MPIIPHSIPFPATEVNPQLKVAISKIKFARPRQILWSSFVTSSQLIKSTSTVRHRRKSIRHFFQSKMAVDMNGTENGSLEAEVRFDMQGNARWEKFILWANIKWMSRGDLHTSSELNLDIFPFYEMCLKVLITYDPLFEFWVPGVLLSGSSCILQTHKSILRLSSMFG